MTHINQDVKNGHSNPYHFDEFTFNLGASEVFFPFCLCSFFMIIIRNKNSPRWDTAIRGDTYKKDAVFIWD